MVRYVEQTLEVPFGISCRRCLGAVPAIATPEYGHAELSLWPEDAQEITAPDGSVMDTMVLLKVDLM